LIDIFRVKDIGKKEIVPTETADKVVVNKNAEEILLDKKQKYYIFQPKQCGDNYDFPNDALEVNNPEAFKFGAKTSHYTIEQKQAINEVFIKDNLNISVVEMFAKYNEEKLCEKCGCPKEYKIFILLSGEDLEKAEEFGLRKLNNEEFNFVEIHVLLADYYLTRIDFSCNINDDCVNMNFAKLCSPNYMCVNKNIKPDNDYVCEFEKKYKNKIDTTLLYYKGVDYIDFRSEDIGSPGANCICINNTCQVK